MWYNMSQFSTQIGENMANLSPEFVTTVALITTFIAGAICGGVVTFILLFKLAANVE